MKNVQSIVCLILDQALFHTKNTYDYSGIDADTWRKVYEEFGSHAMISIPADILQQIPMPEDLKKEWEQSILFQSMHFFRMAEQQSEMLELFRAQSVPVVVLKGMAAAVSYPYPWLRSFGDIDFIVHPDCFEKAKEILLSNDYMTNSDHDKEDDEDNRHIGLVKNDIHFEMHRFFAKKDDSDRLKILDHIIIENIGNSETCQINQYTFPALPTIPNGLVLLKHIQQHLQMGIGLRQILDWLVFAKQNVTDQSWETFKEQSDRIGLTGLAIYVTRMGQLFLGFPEDQYTWCHGADEEICRGLMNYVVKSGNFGLKQEDSSIMTGAMTRMRKNFFHTLQSSGESNWKLLKKWPMLRPFAWVYQICRYVKLGIGNRDGIGAIIKSNQSSRELNVIMKELDL